MEITLIILLALGIFWHSTMQARERGVAIAKQVCSEIGTKLLDDTIFLSHTSIKKNIRDQYQIRRIYTFRYLDVESNIHEGTLILLGVEQESLLLDT
ncbi:MAG: DUF3301 domain-containing protein [Magnetococcales bacterium]|nr:DUF3301 domain-containing protein [Magnetococcales bacterium]